MDLMSHCPWGFESLDQWDFLEKWPAKLNLGWPDRKEQRRMIQERCWVVSETDGRYGGTGRNLLPSSGLHCPGLHFRKKKNPLIIRVRMGWWNKVREWMWVPCEQRLGMQQAHNAEGQTIETRMGRTDRPRELHCCGVRQRKGALVLFCVSPPPALLADSSPVFLWEHCSYLPAKCSFREDCHP